MALILGLFSVFRLSYKFHIRFPLFALRAYVAVIILLQILDHWAASLPSVIGKH